jgi:hypothetical protein
MLDRDVVDHQRGMSDQEQLLAQRAFFAAPFPTAPDDLTHTALGESSNGPESE